MDTFPQTTSAHNANQPAISSMRSFHRLVMPQLRQTQEERRLVEIIRQIRITEIMTMTMTMTMTTTDRTLVLQNFI